MGASEKRFNLLTRLVWQLKDHDRGVMLVFPVRGEPAVWVSLPDGRRFVVMAVEQQGGWGFVWGSFFASADEISLAAARIAAACE
ncbi:hypothetical protein GCM10027589_18240 [Actinocorallia lasiicapitis]